MGGQQEEPELQTVESIESQYRQRAEAFAENAKTHFADVIIDPGKIEFLKDSVGLQHIIGKGAFGHVSH